MTGKMHLSFVKSQSRCIYVNILVLILYYIFARCYHWVKPGEGYTGLSILFFITSCAPTIISVNIFFQKTRHNFNNKKWLVKIIFLSFNNFYDSRHWSFHFFGFSFCEEHLCGRSSIWIKLACSEFLVN